MFNPQSVHPSPLIRLTLRLSDNLSIRCFVWYFLCGLIWLAAATDDTSLKTNEWAQEMDLIFTSLHY